MRRLAALLTVVLTLLAVPAAAADDTQARYNAATLAYDRGDFATALRSFRSLAQLGHPDSEFMLGAMHFYGKGVPRDDALAAIWFHKAASKGNTFAQLAMGSVLISGLGVRQDLVKAYTWLTLAANDGAPVLRQQAIQIRDEAARLMRPDEIADAARQAADWTPRRSGLTWDH